MRRLTKRETVLLKRDKKLKSFKCISSRYENLILIIAARSEKEVKDIVMDKYAVIQTSPMRDIRQMNKPGIAWKITVG